VILKGSLEIRVWLVLLIFLFIIGLLIYILKITLKLGRYEKLFRSQSDINESISELSTKLNTALKEIKSEDSESDSPLPG
jgi:cytoskeletal protein RodZ